MKEWKPESLLDHLREKRQVITKARVQLGGDSPSEGIAGVVAVFITQSDKRFTYQMPSVSAADDAVKMLIQEHPDLFPLVQTSRSLTRAVYKRRHP